MTASSASPCVFTLSNHTLLNGNRVKLGGTPPTGFTAGTSYWVVSAATNTFQLAATPGGTGVNSSSTGTSVTVTEVAQQSPVDLWLFDGVDTHPLSAADNTTPAPSAAASAAMRSPVRLSVYDLLGQHAVARAEPRRRFRAGTGTRDLHGLLVWQGTNPATMSRYASLLLRLAMENN